MTFLEMTLSGTVFILAITAFRTAALRRLPKGTFVALWWAAALRLLVPVNLPSRLSVYTLLEALRLKAARPAVPAAPAGQPSSPSQVLIIPSPRPAVPQPPPEPVSQPFPVWTVLWMTGAVLLALWFLVRYVRWRRRFRESVPAACPGADTCLRSWRKVRLRVSGQIKAPLTYGFLRPVILLPGTLDLRDEEAVTCVLAHEMSHIRRLDGLLKLALTAALCLHWFNPAVWLLYVLANRDMELRCDEAAVLALGEDSRERYALVLIRMAELQNERVPLCGFSHKSGMEERIRAIMSIRKKSMLACVLALVLALGMTTAFATSARPVEADGASGAGGEADMVQLSKEIEAEWDDTLAPYTSFGLTYTFDDPDHDGNGLTMWFEGREVRGIFDGKSGAWITERSGNGAYGSGAVELYAVYDDNGLTGLRFASEEEQAAWTAAREAGKAAAEALAESVYYDSGSIYFTIPEGEGRWNLFLDGQIATSGGKGKPVRYLGERSEKADWIPGATYAFAVENAAYDTLTMEAGYDGAEAQSFDLTRFLPEGGKPLTWPEFSERKADVPEDAELIWPVDGGIVARDRQSRVDPISGETVTHNGVDIGGLEKGTPICAAGGGTVKETGFNAQDGNYIRLDHGRGLETFYAHCQSVEVKQGEEVCMGQVIATVGSTGMSTGPHLHFEFLVNGVATDFESNCRKDDTSVRFVGKEASTDLPAGASNVQEKAAKSPEISFEPTLDAERYYEAGNLPLFQMAFSRLDKGAQGKWLDRIYEDRDIAFFGAAAGLLGEDHAAIEHLAETVYNDGGIAFFSNLTMHMSEEMLEAWLDRALEDEKWAFQSVLFNALDRDGEFDELKEKREKEWEEAQRAEYQAAGVTIEGKHRYYQGQLVNIFLDIRANGSFYTLDMNPAGTVNIKIVRGEDGKIEGAAYMTDAEIAELFDQHL